MSGLRSPLYHERRMTLTFIPGQNQKPIMIDVNYFFPYCLTRKSYHKRIVASTNILPGQKLKFSFCV